MSLLCGFVCLLTWPHDTNSRVTCWIRWVEPFLRFSSEHQVISSSPTSAADAAALVLGDCFQQTSCNSDAAFPCYLYVGTPFCQQYGGYIWSMLAQIFFGLRGLRMTTLFRQMWYKPVCLVSLSQHVTLIVCTQLSCILQGHQTWGDVRTVQRIWWPSR